MKNEQKHFFQNTQPYYAINEQDVVTHYVYYKSQHSLVRHVLCGLAIMSGLMICGLSLAAWWKTISFYNASSFSFANYYGSHMVLQCAPSRANIWGWAKQSDIGLQVTVTLKNSVIRDDTHLYKALVRSGPIPGSAVWQVLLDPVNSSGNAYTISAELGLQLIEINDILFGDVWVCSGQSNMQFSVEAMFNASDELAGASYYPNIRLFNVAMIPADVPQYELLDISLHWTLPNASTLKGFSAICWLYGKEIHKNIGIPLGLMLSCWGGTIIEAWSSPDALKVCNSCGIDTESAVAVEANISPADESPFLWKQKEVKDNTLPSDSSQTKFDYNPYPNRNSVLWNAMIHPLLNLTITGALWYQGESNALNPYRRDLYNCTFHVMIKDWRRKFNEFSFHQTSVMFPFGFVQLGANDKGSASRTDGLSDVRWHQTADIGFVPNSRLQNVFMGTAFDTTDFSSPTGGIHPRDKITPAHRLALAGLAVAYGQSSLHYRGPTPTSLKADYGNNTLIIEFDWSQGSDYIIDIFAKFGFDVCCSHDGKTGCSMSGIDWTEVDIVDFSDFTVTVSWQSCQGLQIMGIRYAWRESPCPYLACSIYGSTTKLPMTPFIYQGLIPHMKIITF